MYKKSKERYLYVKQEEREISKFIYCCCLLLFRFTCSLNRALHLEILPNQTTQEFVQALKRLIARMSRPNVIYSDNAKAFEKDSKSIKKVYMQFL